MNLPRWLPESRQLGEEPWVKLDTGSDLLTWGRSEEVAYNQANRQAQKYLFYINAFDFIRSLGITGDYYEFGCHRVRTFRMALTEARRHNLDEMRFFAFDSFQGLPEPQSRTGVREYFGGALATSEEQFREIVREHGIYTDHIRTVKGFYAQSLNEALQTSLLAEGSRVAIVCVDCDLYESAVPVFRFLRPLIQEGTLLYIDDYFAGYKGSLRTGPAQAFHKFERDNEFKFSAHMQVGWWGRSFIAYS